MFDVAIVGGGPAGSSCAAFCAGAGLRTLLLEREKFPREKVCGDCINPACWPVLQRLGLAERVRALPHGTLERVDFVAIGGRTISVTLPAGDKAEIAVKRSLFDALLMNRARENGAEISDATIVTALDQTGKGWTISADDKAFRARFLVAADGRNSTVARLRNLLPRNAIERIALQTHLPLPKDFGNRVVLEFLPQGYSGQAPVGDGQLNVCLVSTPRKIPQLRQWAEERFGVPKEHPWRSITPLTRAPITRMEKSLFLVGDAARVVEPFTGEGIYYALASGELAAKAIVEQMNGANDAETAAAYSAAHARLYSGRLWINRLARAAVLSPKIASSFIELARFQPAILRFLTAKIVG